MGDGATAFFNNGTDTLYYGAAFDGYTGVAPAWNSAKCSRGRVSSELSLCIGVTGACAHVVIGTLS
jgi:hypothetical protein